MNRDPISNVNRVNYIRPRSLRNPSGTTIDRRSKLSEALDPTTPPPDSHLQFAVSALSTIFTDRNRGQRQNGELRRESCL